MRLHKTLFYTLAISAWATLSACGTPPRSNDGGDTSPLCSSDSSKKADDPACTTTPDAGPTADADAGTPTDPCAGLVPPLATQCTPDTGVYFTFTWRLKATRDGSECLLFGAGAGRRPPDFVMTPEMSGAAEFTSTDGTGQQWTCVQ